MIKSMTGYGTCEISSEKVQGNVEIMAKNHRYLDMRVSLPKELNSFEIPIQKMISGKISRGKIELSIQLKSLIQPNYSLTINRDLLKEYKNILTDLKIEFGYSGQIDIVNVAKFNDLIMSNKNAANTEEYFPYIESAVLKAISALDEMRTSEGNNLKIEIAGLIGNLAGYLEKVESKRKENIDEYHKKVKERIKSIIDESNLDENRIYQEIAYIIDKTDITEEITRLKSHFDQFNSMLGEAEPVGKKLDFLFQEMNREINTIGSKANDFNRAGLVINMKNDLEKAREQAQNIE